MSPRRPEIRIFDEWAIRSVADADLALRSADRAFRAMALGQVDLPSPYSADFAKIFGEVHMKGAHMVGSDYFVFKFATGFYNNIEMGVPTGSGLMLIFEATTGFPRAILFDNGYLTDLRTAAAGALAARHLTLDEPLRVAVIGSGVQGRLQAQMLQCVRAVGRLRVWSRRASARRAYVERMAEQLPGVDLDAAETVQEAVAGADLVITATPSREPLVRADMLEAGMTIVALGSDGPDKCELAPEVLAAADKVITDRTDQCLALGELHHAVEAGLLTAEDVYAELGAVVEEQVPGREGDERIVCDLTGVGVQDAAIAEATFNQLLVRAPTPTPT